MTTLTRGTIKAYDPVTHRASVQLAGSLAVWLDGLPVAIDVAPDDVQAGRDCAVLLYTDDNPDDAVVVTVHGAVPGAGRWRRIMDADSDTYVHTEHIADEDKVRIVTGGVLRTLFQGTTPELDHTGDAKISGGLGLRGTTPGAANAITGTFTYAGGGAPDWMLATLIVDAAASGASGARGVTGEARLAAGHAVATSYLRGLEFRANHLGSALVTDQVGCQALAQGTGPATNRIGGTFELSTLITTATLQIGVRASATRNGAGTVPSVHLFYSQLLNNAATITDVYHYAIGSITNLGGGVLTTHYGFCNPGMTVGTNRRPFWDAGIGGNVSDAGGNRFRSNTAFGTVATANMFGGGDGVIHIANAPTAPTANPAGGGILYAVAGALTWRGSGGTITTIAPA